LVARGIVVVFAGAALAGIVAMTRATITPATHPQSSAPTPKNTEPSDPALGDRDSEYNKHLTDEQYRVTCRGGTELPFKGAYWNHKDVGLYKCIRCKTSLFDSSTKYDSGTGWPSFYEPIDEQAVDTRVDGTLFEQRTEVICRKCHAHLGHVFTDGPTDKGGARYCINSASLDFEPTAADSK
jgi:peptide-methionine (R)-S-oxide reductase